MTQKQKNQGNIDLANMLKLFVQENCQSEEADDNMEVTVSEDSIEEEASNTDVPYNIAKLFADIFNFMSISNLISSSVKSLYCSLSL